LRCSSPLCQKQACKFSEIQHGLTCSHRSSAFSKDEQQGRDQNALIGVIGSRTRVYEVLRRDRALPLAMIRRLNKSLDIPAEVFIRPVRKRKRRA